MVFLERLVLLLIGMVLGAYIQVETSLFSLNSSDQFIEPKTQCYNLAQFIEYDIRMMSIQSEFPISIEQINNVKIHTESQNISNLINSCNIKIFDNQTGKFLVDIEAFDFHDDEGDGIIAQYSVIDLKTKNKVWETAHSLKLTNFRQKKSPVSKD